MNAASEKIKRQIRLMLSLFIVLLVLSGASAIPAEAELNFLLRFLRESSIKTLLGKVATGVTDASQRYPFLFYGYLNRSSSPDI